MRIIKEREKTKISSWILLIFKVAAVCTVLLTIVFQPPSVKAHSTLLETNPAEDEIIEDSPSTLELRFNEPVEHDLAMVTIYNRNAETIFTDSPDGDIERAPLLEFSLPDLEEGTYTVNWNIVSADGHPVSGSYTFSVGQPTQGEAVSAGNNDYIENLLIAVRIIPEGLILLGAGLFWFAWLAERRKFTSLDIIWRKRRHIGGLFILLGIIAELVTYLLSLPSGIISVILNGRWELLLQFPFLLMLFAQIILLLLLFIPGMMTGWYLTLWLVLAVTPAFGGHVWGMQQPIIALIPRIIHQVSIAFWLGALSYVILTLIWQRKQKTTVSWKDFRPFFVSNMVGASLLVVVSGMLMVFLQTGFSAVFTDWNTWSALVIIKVILTITMLGMALFQTLKWKRNKTFMTEHIVRREWIIGLIIIVFGVWMSQITYPNDVKTYNETLITDDVEIEINIEGLEVGDQKMTADISSFNNQRPEEVHIKVSMPAHNMESGELDATENKTGHHTLQLPFTMAGDWKIKIVSIYPDGEKKEWNDEVFIEGK